MKTTRFFALLAILLFATLAQSQSLKTRSNSSKNENSPNLPEPKPAQEIGNTTASIANILKDKIEICDKKNQLTDFPVDLKVLDDRIDFKIKNQNTVIYFTEGLDYVIPPPFPGNQKLYYRLKILNLFQRALTVI